MEKPGLLSSDDPQVQDVVELLRELLHAFLMASVPVWLDLPLTLPQLRTVFIIAHNKTSSVMQIAKHLGIGEPTASHLVDKLVQAGLVDRSEDPMDRRRAIVQLSPAGEELIEKLLGWEEFLGAWLHKVSKEDLSLFRHGLNAIVNEIHEQTTKDGQASEDEDQEISTP
ncbi:MAG: MarR family transcriptional regulator [Anaerolineaceae bacterium]|jgi:DNA-binding MarR family transcriptional regulator